MRSFKVVAAASAGATFFLIAIGGLVRATKSGLGCGTDWPNCSGRLWPAIQNRAMTIEYSHRFFAGLLIALVTTLAIVAYKQGLPQRVQRATLLALGLVCFQALLGAVVVVLELHAVSVVLHLAAALSLLAVVLYIVLTVDVEPRNSDPTLARRITWTAGTVMVLLLVGSYVTGAVAGYVFPDWPLMDGRVVPDLAVESKAIHFLHRALAGVVGAVLLWAAIGVIRSKDELPLASKFAHSAIGLFAIEVAVGAGNVFTGGNDAFVTLHLALGAAIWGSLVCAAVALRPVPVEETARVSERVRLRGSEA